MGRSTSIGWTDATFNPWWGCLRVSPGCEHCYAETFAKRVGQDVWGPAKTTGRRTFSDAHWKQPERWNGDAAAAGERMRVFCASMADVFEDHPALPSERARLFDLIERTPNLDWQLLTKRPENVLGMVPDHWLGGFPPNVWVGASAEDQQRLNERLRSLVHIPAAVRFLSCEPLVGPMSFRWLAAWPESAPYTAMNPAGATDHLDGLRRIQWVIIGGESGRGARPMDLENARELVAQCREARVACFVKQLGAAHAPGRFDAKAEDPTHWPPELRVRQFPVLPMPVELEAQP